MWIIGFGINYTFFYSKEKAIKDYTKAIEFNTYLQRHKNSKINNKLGFNLGILLDFKVEIQINKSLLPLDY